MTQGITQYELGLDDRLPQLVNYSVRVSSRARNVNLRVLPVTGLEITIPERFGRRNIPQLIEDNRAWIEKQLAWINENTNPEYLVWPPDALNLRAHSRSVAGSSEGPDQGSDHGSDPGSDPGSDHTWAGHNCGLKLRIIYVNEHVGPGTANGQSPDHHSDPNTDLSDSLVARLIDDTLTVSGLITSRRQLLDLLAKVLKCEADKVFRPQLAGYAEQFGLEYKKMVVRGQRTLWGSYSSSGTLSLNFKLLFLPPELARYVLLHELAHTRYLNHSASFWRYLSSLEPRARNLDRSLNLAAEFVPPWFESVT